MPEQTLLAEVEQERNTLPIRKIANYLQARLGQKPVAYVAGLKDVRQVGRWASGKHVPHDEVDMRLRHAYEVVRLIVETYDDRTAMAWLFGTNTRLDDQAPAYVLRHAETWDDLRYVVPVARAFAGNAS